MVLINECWNWANKPKIKSSGPGLPPWECAIVAITYSETNALSKMGLRVELTTPITPQFITNGVIRVLVDPWVAEAVYLHSRNECYADLTLVEFIRKMLPNGT